MENNVVTYDKFLAYANVLDSSFHRPTGLMVINERVGNKL